MSMNNPNQGLDPQVAALIAQMVNPKNQFDKSDYNRLFDPMVGVLSGTYTQPQKPQQSQEDLIFRYMPTYNQIKNSGYYDENSIEQNIITSLEEGAPLGVVKQMILDLLSKEGNTNQSTSTELAQLATKLDSEMHSYKIALMNERDKTPEKTVYQEAGLRDPSEQYDVDSMLGIGYAQAAERGKPIEVTPEQKSYQRFLQNQQNASEERNRNIDFAGQSAEIEMRKRFTPYSAGGLPGVGDAFSSMFKQQTKDFSSKNPLDKFNAVTGLSWLTGLGKTSRDFVDVMASDIFQGQKAEQKRAEEYIKSKEIEAGTPSESNREMNQMLVRQQAMSKNPSKGKNKVFVPIRTELVNAERANRAASDMLGMRELVAKRLASTGQTPYNDDMVRRALYIKAAGR